MRFGVFLLAAQFPGQSHSAVLDAAVATAVAAEQAGFDEVWVAEHHFMSYGVCPSALTMAGYLLGVTRHIAVGTAVSVLSTQHPVAVAEQALLLDQLSRGRLRLGVGRGGPWIDQRVFEPFSRRAGFVEALDLLLSALTGNEVRGDGPAFDFPAVSVVPGPRTRPRPPVVLAATTTATVELAASRRLPLLLGMHADDAEKAAAVRRYADLVGVGGLSAGHISAGVAFVADSDEEATATMRSHLPRWLGPGLAGYRRADGAVHRTRDPDEYAELLCRLHPVGSAAECRRRIARTARRTGIDHLILLVDGTGDPERTCENIRRLGADVLPALR